MTTKTFHSRRAAEREALKREQSARQNFYLAMTNPTGQHYVEVYTSNMRYVGNVI